MIVFEILKKEFKLILSARLKWNAVFLKFIKSLQLNCQDDKIIDFLVNLLNKEELRIKNENIEHSKYFRKKTLIFLII